MCIINRRIISASELWDAMDDFILSAWMETWTDIYLQAAANYIVTGTTCILFNKQNSYIYNDDADSKAK